MSWTTWIESGLYTLIISTLGYFVTTALNGLKDMQNKIDHAITKEEVKDMIVKEIDYKFNQVQQQIRNIEQNMKSDKEDVKEDLKEIKGLLTKIIFKHDNNAPS